MKNKLEYIDLGYIQIAYSVNVYGICFFDKYCFINIFGFEILK
jgi:hypothetical protein